MKLHFLDILQYTEYIDREGCLQSCAALEYFSLTLLLPSCYTQIGSPITSIDKQNMTTKMVVVSKRVQAFSEVTL